MTTDKPMTVDALMDELVEAARLLGSTQAAKGFGAYMEQDAMFERSMYESIAKHRAAIEQYGREQYARGVNDAWPAGRGSGEPVAWIQPDHLQKARVAPFLCRVEPTKRCSDFVPIYTAPQSREC